MKQEAEKIYNIEHADNVVIDMRGLLEAEAGRLNVAMERFPGLIVVSGFSARQIRYCRHGSWILV